MDIIERAKELRTVIESLSSDANNETAKNYPEILPIWSYRNDYKNGDRVNVHGKLYKAVARFEGQEFPLLDFEEVVEYEGSDIVIEEWSANDAPYNIGDKIVYGGKIYICIIGDNYWTPDVYPNGWSLK